MSTTRDRIASWNAFLNYVSSKATTVPAYSYTDEAGAERFPDEDPMPNAAFTLFFQLSRGERFDVLEDALAQGGLNDRYNCLITSDRIDEYVADERCGEDDAFMNLAMWTIGQELAARGL